MKKNLVVSILLVLLSKTSKMFEIKYSSGQETTTAFQQEKNIKNKQKKLL